MGTFERVHHRLVLHMPVPLALPFFGTACGAACGKGIPALAQGTR